MALLNKSVFEPPHDVIIGFIKANYDNIPTRLQSVPISNGIYIYRKSNNKDINVDGFRWHQSSKYENKASGLTITRFYVNQKGEKEKKAKFKKAKFELDGCDQGLLYYSGDCGSIEPEPHGNSKTNKPYFRTIPSTINTIKSHQFTKSVPKDYNNLTKELKSHNQAAKSEDEKAFIDKHVVPRNPKQVENVKQKLIREKDLHHDELFSIYLIAKSQLAETILYIQIIPEVIIICALPAAIKLANRLLTSTVPDLINKQCLTYDTTFNLCDLYVSFIVMRNTEIVDNPIFPVLMIYHSSKSAKIHEILWKEYAINLLKLPANIPIIVDREKSITKALIESGLTENLVYCKLHLQRDIKFWCIDKLLPPKNYAIYNDMVDKLVLAENETEFHLLNNKFKTQMSQAFRTYYERDIENDLKNCLCKFSLKRFTVFQEGDYPTTNIAEAFNSVVKNYQENKDARIDILLLSMLELQCSILSEFNRALNNCGKFTIKANLKDDLQRIDIDCALEFKSSQEIIALIKESSIKEESSRNAADYMADMVINNRLVAFEPHNMVYTVKCPFSGVVHSVSIKDKDKRCTCPAKKSCFHIKAVMKITGHDKNKDVRNFKLTSVDKNLKEFKAGRKQKKTVKIIYQPADDSLIMQNPDKPLIKVEPTDDEIKNDKTNTNSLIDIELLSEEVSAIEQDQWVHEIIRSIPTNYKVPVTKLSSLACLRSDTWLSDNVMNDFCNHTIITANLDSKILLIPSYIFQCCSARLSKGIEADAKTQEVAFLNQHRAVNKEIFVAVINTDHEKGSHWLIGISIFKTKTIILIDSMHGGTIGLMSKLFEIVKLSFNLAESKVNIDEWNFVVATDVIEQHDSTECGVYACMAVLALVNERKFIHSPIDGRNLIKYTLTRAKTPKSPKKPAKISKIFPEIYNGNQTNNSKISIKRDEVNEIIVKEIRAAKQISRCYSDVCYDEEDDKTKMDLCIICRLWYHRLCHRQYVATYFKCAKCLKLLPLKN